MGKNILERAGLLRRTEAAEELLLAEVRAAGAEFQRVVFTRNRRVMVSVGDGGETLRLHRIFEKAPREVWSALGRMYVARTQRGRAGARRVVQQFLQENPPAVRPRARRRILPEDREHVARLQAEFDRVNEIYFDGALPRVPLALSGRMRRRNGHFSTHPLEIVVSRTLCLEAEAGESEQTLRHEMIHLWQHVQGRRPDHGAEFRQWARRLGVHPRATRTVRWKTDDGPTRP